jgi:transposase
MIQLSPGTRVLAAIEPVDMRKGIDGLVAVCRQKLESDPMTGAVFVFTNRNRTHVRLLTYDGQGFWLCTKRLSSGRFPHWPRGTTTTPLTAEQLFILLRGGDPSEIRTLGEWRRLGT